MNVYSDNSTESVTGKFSKAFWMILLPLGIFLLFGAATEFFALRGRDGTGASGETFYGDPHLFATDSPMMDMAKQSEISQGTNGISFNQDSGC